MNSATKKPQAVTVHRDFCRVNPDGDKIFSVRGGVPLSDAFDKLSALLSSSISTVEAVADTDDIQSALWQTSHMLNFSYELLQSIHDGHNKFRSEI